MRFDAQSAAEVFQPANEQNRLRSSLNTLLFDVHHPAGRLVNLVIMVLILISVLISMIGTIKDLDSEWVARIQFMEFWVTVIFAGELLMRCYAARQLRAYLFSFYGMVDLLSVLPFILIGDPNLAIRLLRIARLLKLVRYLKVLTALISSMKDTFEILLIVFGSIALGAVLAGNVVYILEPETFSSAFEGAWWSISTMTTVGYGDLVPHSAAGKLVAACLMVVGICMFAVVTAVVSVKVARTLHHGVQCEECEKSIAPEYLYCPYCSADQQHKNTTD